MLVIISIVQPAMAQSTADAEPPAANAALAEMIENPDTRQQLIDQLRGAAENTPAGAALPEDEEPTLPRQLAETTSKVVNELTDQGSQAINVVGNLFRNGLTEEATIDIDALTTASINLGIVVLATFGIFFLIRRLSRHLFMLLSQWSLHGQGFYPMVRLLISVAVAALIDTLIVGLAYVGGNLLATFALGESGELSTQASLFLNAFLIIELLKVAVRVLFSTRYEGLRLLHISSADASYWNRWIARLIGLAGYGLMVVVPLLNAYLSPTLGSNAGTLIMIFTYFYAVSVVLINRKKIRDAIYRSAKKTSMTVSRVSLQLFSRIWHLFALAYFTLVLVLTLTRPDEALLFVMKATAQTLIAILLGMLLSRFLTQIIGRRIKLSEELCNRLPLLESRLNSYIPTGLRIARTLILVVVFLLVLDAWTPFNLSDWYASEAGGELTGKLTSLITILIIAAGVWIGLASLIEDKLNPNANHEIPSARAQTLLTLFRNALAITLLTMTTMVVLSEIGINVGPLIAGAGVLGLAIGVGSQSLVRDIITGIFIQIENAMNVGDVVTVSGITGTAERLSIRSVGIRDLSGTYHIVPFSSVDTVSNYMREFGNHVGEYSIAYRESIDDAVEHLKLAFEDLKVSEAHGHKLLAPIDIPGVTSLGDSAVNIRVVLKTTPGDQWAVGRAYNRLVKMRFDAAGIEIPFPHMNLYFGQDKTGSAPPANLRVMEQDFTIDGSPAGQPKTLDNASDDRFDPRKKRSHKDPSKRRIKDMDSESDEDSLPTGGDVE
ncbi:mechanosensitive ion channel domain-containing protein [Halomonas halocynthiae]|uniref:mechanosensitive ion channel domain-containing protein n=1 Tax=Halomonas halocynthiae TaxID=176290 RepID=UPI00068526C7|nr:mechanosensitive ion channel domain-containing protein [Halomonas halocynthiae]